MVEGAEVEGAAAHGVGRSQGAEGLRGASKEGLASWVVPAVASHTLLGPGAASVAGTQHQGPRHHQVLLRPIAGAWAAAAEEAAAAAAAADLAVGGLKPPAAVPVPGAFVGASLLAAAAAA